MRLLVARLSSGKGALCWLSPGKVALCWLLVCRVRAAAAGRPTGCMLQWLAVSFSSPEGGLL